MNIRNIFTLIGNCWSNPKKSLEVEKVLTSCIQQAERKGQIPTVNLSEIIGRSQVCSMKKILSPDVQYLKKFNDRYLQTDVEISQKKQEIIGYLKNISSNLENLAISSESDKVDNVLAQKAVIDYLTEHIDYNKQFFTSGFEFGLPTKKIESSLEEFQEEFDKSVSCFKEQGILSASDYDFKKYQFDSNAIMNKYRETAHKANQRKYSELFDPLERLSGSSYNCHDPYLSRGNFYRIISPPEFKNLLETKYTGEYIDANGYFTGGHYSCITTNPDYNEQCFEANGLPIRLKFKTKDSNGLFNMDLMDRIGGLKQERSIYRVWGYNFYDIDWDNVCIKSRGEWKYLDKDFIKELMSKL